MSIEEGVDTIEHGSYLDEDPDLIKMMADQGAFLVPTLTVFVFHRDMGTPEAQIEAHDFRHHHVETVQKAMESEGVPPDAAQISMIPKTTIALDDKQAEQTLRLLDTLEDLEDVQKAYTNADFSSEVLERYQLDS